VPLSPAIPSPRDARAYQERTLIQLRALRALRVLANVRAAKASIEQLLADEHWPTDRTLSLTLDRLQVLKEQANETITKVIEAGHLITPASKNETNRVGRQLVDARESGDIPWAGIVDETRRVEGAPTWNDPAAFAETVTRAYRRNKWQAQPVRLEVWSEKGTVRGTLAPVLDRYEVPFRVQHGFASATALYAVAREYVQQHRQLLEVLYVGDWDPSGLHMSEEDDYCLKAWGEHGIPAEGDDDVAIGPSIYRIALVEADVANRALPSFSADDKRGDPRYRWFVEEYGDRCWELDALSPVTLRERVEAAIVERLDRAGLGSLCRGGAR